MSIVQKLITPVFVSLAGIGLAACDTVDEKIAYCTQDMDNKMSYSIVSRGISGIDKIVLYTAPQTFFNAASNKLEGPIVKSDVIRTQDRAELMVVDLEKKICTVLYDNGSYRDSNSDYQFSKKYVYKGGHDFNGI